MHAVYARKQLQYSEVGAVEKRYMVNSGAGTADRGGLVFYSNTGRTLIYYLIMFKHLVPVPVNYATGTPGDVVASGLSLVAGAPSGRCGHARAA